MTIKYIILLLLILLIFSIFFKYNGFKKQENFLELDELDELDGPEPKDFSNDSILCPKNHECSYYYKKHNADIIYSSKCVSTGKKKRYIWKDEWRNKKSKYKENENFKDTKFIINKEKVKNCYKHCLDNTNCKGYSLKYRDGKPIRCIMHNSEMCENKCYNESFLCVHKNIKNIKNIKKYSKNDSCKKDCPKEPPDKGDENDTPQITWKQKEITNMVLSFFDKCEDKGKCFKGEIKEILPDIINKKDCANECYKAKDNIMNNINCTGFRYDKTNDTCTLFGFASDV
jgi:hypothetical protein